jgi:Terpene cyclase DEP1
MKPKILYLALCILGLVLPYGEFVPWLLQHGLNLPLFARELFAHRVAAFFGTDVIVSAVALLVFARIESARMGIRNRWVVLVAVLTVGVSLGLPLFLYLRERELERGAAPAAA